MALIDAAQAQNVTINATVNGVGGDWAAKETYPIVLGWGVELSAPWVFFLDAKNGATVTSPVHMKFGSQGIEISPVPPGDLKTTRPGVAHYHVGIDQPCLPPGKTIVKGTPSWVHFGDGKDVFDSQLTPGKHKLALQLGDDLHNTMPGACSVITVTVK
jgi:hypothetical protein